MPKEGQASITVRKELVDKIRSCLDPNPKPRSVAEFVTLAVMEKLERLAKEGGG